MLLSFPLSPETEFLGSGTKLVDFLTEFLTKTVDFFTKLNFFVVVQNLCFVPEQKNYTITYQKKGGVSDVHQPKSASGIGIHGHYVLHVLFSPFSRKSEMSTIEGNLT